MSLPAQPTRPLRRTFLDETTLRAGVCWSTSRNWTTAMKKRTHKARRQAGRRECREAAFSC